MQAYFIKSAADAAGFPDDSGSEVAIVGRSNSGKSSAINTILGSTKLARVSKTPGRTQLINFFNVGERRRLVDLPGYGYARVATSMRSRWQSLVTSYFRRRKSLSGLVITLDVRRGITDLDARMLAWAERLGIPVLLLVTKTDKLSRGRASARVLGIREDAPETAAVQAFSALSGRGASEARAWIGERLGIADGHRAGQG
jgi:GTP-binding protein